MQVKDIKELLQVYSEFLEEEGYLDTDWRNEGEPISDFIKSKQYRRWSGENS